MKFIQFFNYKIFCDDLSNLFSTNSKKLVINTLNPYSFLVAEKDRQFKKALINSDILLPDGVGIVWASRYLQNERIRKIAGYDLFMFLMSAYNKKTSKVFFLGSTKATLKKIEERISNDYPNITCNFYSPPFCQEFSIDDNKMILEKINTFKPDILFIGMTAPKQEKWVFNNNALINAKLIASIGAVFDFYAQTIKRPSQFWIKLNLEWLIRLLKEPSRLWKRNFIYTPLFILAILKAKMRIKNSKVNC